MWALLATGVLGSFHCVGMCGGLVLALDRPSGLLWRRLYVQALFHLGKTATYVSLGLLVGLLGGALLRAPAFRAAQAFLGVLAGLLMVLAGFQILGWLGSLPLGPLFGPGSLYGRAVRAVVNLRTASAPVALGILTGLLPCPLVYAFLAEALRRAHVFESMAVMAILGLASLPALVFVVLTASRLSPRLRVAMIRGAGALVVLLGVITAVRAAFPGWMHTHGGVGG